MKTQNNFVNTYSSNMLQTLSQIDPNDKGVFDSILNITTIKVDDVEISIYKPEKFKGLKVDIKKLIDILIFKLCSQTEHGKKTKKEQRIVAIKYSKVFELTGKTNNSTQKYKLNNNLEILSNLSISWDEKRKNKNLNYSNVKFCEQLTLNKHEFIFEFTEQMANYIVFTYISKYPIQLLKVKEYSDTAYIFGKKIAVHHSIKRNIKKDTNNCLSVKKLLSCCPVILKYEDVSKKHRQIHQLIINPFENALDKLSFIKWEYCQENKQVLDNDKLDIKTYSIFIDLYIKFRFI